MTILEKAIIDSIKLEIFNQEVNIDYLKNFSNEQYLSLYKLSDSLDLGHIVASVLIKNKIINEESSFFPLYKKVLMTAIYRTENANVCYNSLINFFNENKIDFIYLKGKNLSDLYNDNWQRQSCDLDFLIKEKDLDNVVLLLQKELNFQKPIYYYHDVSIYSSNKVHLELHFNILENDKKFDTILKDCWNYAEKIGNNSEYKFNLDFFIFYQIVHTAYHFIGGGCGVKPIVDFYLLNKKYHDNIINNNFIHDCNLDVFVKELIDLSEFWFENEKENELLSQMTNFIFNGGSYGTTEVNIKIKRLSQNKFIYILKRLFPSYSILSKRYPKLRKIKILYPWYLFVRIITIPFSKNKKNIKREIELNNKIKKDDNLSKLLNDLNLK